MTPDPAKDDGASLSEALERWLEGTSDKTVGSLIDVFEEKSFAVLFVVLMAVPALPAPTGGVTHVCLRRHRAGDCQRGGGGESGDDLAGLGAVHLAPPWGVIRDRPDRRPVLPSADRRPRWENGSPLPVRVITDGRRH